MIQEAINPELIQYILLSLCVFIVFLAGLGLGLAGIFLWWVYKRGPNAKR